MGVFNNWDYDTEGGTDAARRAELAKEFLDSDETHLLVLDKKQNHGGLPHHCYLKSKHESKNEREDCADCIYPERKCSECINKARKEDEDG